MRAVFDPDAAQALCVEYAAGATVRDLAAAHHASDATIRRTLARAGAAIRPVGPRPKTTHGEDDDLAYTGGWVRDGLILRPAAVAP